MSTSPDRLVADLVGDRYEITGLIASGGMGSVYRARDTVLDRTVALKVLRTGDEGEAFIDRFKTEATNAARLSHPNIVQVYDFGYAEGAPYMAMEFVDGQTLREIIQSKRVLRPDLAARIATAVAAALEHARRAGIVHRDIKPENILVTTDGQIKVADFGLSHAMAEVRATQTGMLLGTAHYLSPEQVQGGVVDHRTDVYALGVVLYEMLTGRPPFQGDTPVVIAYRRVNEDVPSVNAINPGAPRELDAIVARATARDPAERTQTAGAMLEALRDAVPRSDTEDLSGLVHHTMAIPIAGEDTITIVRRDERGRKRRWRKRRIIALATLVVVLIATAAIVRGPLALADVPDVGDLSQSDAKSLLVEAGFTVDNEFQNSSTVPEGEVIRQVPLPGTSLRRGKPVTLVISLGPKLVEVPSLEGKRFAVAEERLRDLGFEVRRVDVFSDEVPRLRVVDQQYEGGNVIEYGSTVTLEVSKGPEMVKVPNVVSDPEAQAVADLEDKEFTVTIQRERNARVPEGAVISQTPKAKTEQPKGSEITLVVSLGPPLVKAPSLECMTKKQAQDKVASVGLKLDFDGSGERVVDQSPPPGDKVAKGSTMTAFLGTGSFC